MDAGEGRRLSGEPLVRFDHVTKRFGEVVAVDDVTLDIAEGERFALLGGSGSGKTTLLRLLAGFEHPTSGRVYIGGEDVTDVPPHRRSVNMMFQSYALFPHMDVERNVGFGLRQEGLPKSDIRSRVTTVLKLVEMERFAKRRPDQLSGGERQRVALARAIVKRPRVLLLDEPLAALDRRLREQTRFELMRIQQEVGITFIVVTHDQEEAMTLATTIGVMNAGRIVQTGTPREIYEAPANRFVADFVGAVNLFDGRVVRQADGVVTLEVGDMPGGLTVRHDATLPPGTPCAVALRPEKLRITREAPAADAGNRIHGAVAEIGYLGASCVFRVRTDGGRVIQAMQANQARDLSLAHRCDDPVWVSWAPESGVLIVG